MVCPHGLYEDECPQCMVAMRQKPLPLINLMPREIPMEIESVNMLMKQKNIGDPNLFENTIFEGRIPNRLSRNFNPALSIFNPTPTKLRRRLKELDARWMRTGDKLIVKETPLFDLKAKFLKNNS